MVYQVEADGVADFRKLGHVPRVSLFVPELLLQLSPAFLNEKRLRDGATCRRIDVLELLVEIRNVLLQGLDGVHVDWLRFLVHFFAEVHAVHQCVQLLFESLLRGRPLQPRRGPGRVVFRRSLALEARGTPRDAARPCDAARRVVGRREGRRQAHIVLRMVPSDRLVQLLLRSLDKRHRSARQVVEHDRIRLDQRHTNGRERIGLQVQQASCECRGGHLHTTFIGTVDLEIVPLRRVQSQEATRIGSRRLRVCLAWVHLAAEDVTELLGLLDSDGRQNASILEDDRHLGHLFDALAIHDPCGRLHLHFPVDPVEVPLAQDSADQLASLDRMVIQGHRLRVSAFFFLARFEVAGLPELCLLGGAFRRLRPGRNDWVFFFAWTQKRVRQVQDLLQLPGRLQLDLLTRPRRPPLVQVQELLPRGGQLHLVFGCPVPMAHHREHRQKLFMFPTVRSSGSALHVFERFLAINFRGEHFLNTCRQGGLRHQALHSSHVAYSSGHPQGLRPEYCSSILVVLWNALDERPTIHVNDV
mmetsp:Transcript_65034/g.188573  ORF Transcript_65034/g.188573 Transcript_65034/m.188573 type:complete len:529 (+) Transcript_65034:879-2465(+)